MSGFCVNASINNLSTPSAAVPEKLHHCGRAFGLLQDIQPAEDCQLAQIGQRLIVLPQDLDLSEYLGQRVGLIRIDEKYLVRSLA
jgi:hypothetical protein